MGWAGMGRLMGTTENTQAELSGAQKKEGRKQQLELELILSKTAPAKASAAGLSERACASA